MRDIVGTLLLYIPFRIRPVINWCFSKQPQKIYHQNDVHMTNLEASKWEFTSTICAVFKKDLS